MCPGRLERQECGTIARVRPGSLAKYLGFRTRSLRTLGVRSYTSVPCLRGCMVTVPKPIIWVRVHQLLYCVLVLSANRRPFTSDQQALHSLFTLCPQKPLCARATIAMCLDIFAQTFSKNILSFLGLLRFTFLPGVPNQFVAQSRCHQ